MELWRQFQKDHNKKTASGTSGPQPYAGRSPYTGRRYDRRSSQLEQDSLTEKLEDLRTEDYTTTTGRVGAAHPQIPPKPKTDARLRLEQRRNSGSSDRPYFASPVAAASGSEESQERKAYNLVAPWRSLDWSGLENMRDNFRKRQISSPEVKGLRILVHGPAGGGKSSLINSIASVFRERLYYGAAVESMAERSFTKILQPHYIHDLKSASFLPFAICDTMGLENGDSAGVLIEDLVKVLQGHIKDGYKFRETTACATHESFYTKNPHLSERIHCLVSVIPADKIKIMQKAVIEKMKEVRQKAADLRIPQMLVVTKVDLQCPAVAEDLKLIYRSKMIKDTMSECSNKLGVPMNCIFPVRCYHDEIEDNSDVNVLLLSALKHILDSAEDYVIDMAHSPAQTKGIRGSHV